ncbi:polyamine aminopropyltransferase [Pseudoalteromonas denitrificans]|uniref:Polyamine aminopropyltransferase n=1 Tax=Pseudoalteromonas denitrificans DSM 6059 TaxID=1123010 RepID=A0A1I1EN50_9GAMM|nr:polyamine aminopropyltransferase [Pseudoalteromonas denitrificans]SFB88447.1 spermidine synthase [Pseudoalteromonas denitrificans DSM 6059]
MNTQSLNNQKQTLWFHDTLLIAVMAILAGCGLIYEYLLSHYAGRILGSVESAIYAMIGTMIVAMGIGAFLARWFKDAFTAFAWLEVLIALLGMSCILFIAGLIAISYTLPHTLSETFNLPPNVLLDGYMFEQLQDIAQFMPYIFGLILGILIGMEIPLIARVRQQVYGRFLENNAGTIYGADYIGAGIGAAIWVTIMLSMPIMQAAAWTALFNIIAGLVFLSKYHKHIRYAKSLFSCHILLLGLFTVLLIMGTTWMKDLSSVLYKDKVIYSQSTKYQHLVLTERFLKNQSEPVTDLYLNGRLQFSSADEQLYHSMLVYPAMAASNRHDNVLIIGGGDGLALRDTLKWPVKSVTLVDLDAQLLTLFGLKSTQHSSEKFNIPDYIKQRVTKLNHNAMQDSRANITPTDAFLEVEKLLDQGKQFDTIIIDLPDPNHPDLNKLYSDYFYNQIRQILAPDGALAIQSTSPYHAQSAFLSIAKTVKYAGFMHVEQYQQNIPSFGQWGWTIATRSGQSASQRIAKLPQLPVESQWLSKEYILASFVFPRNFFKEVKSIEINRLGSGVLYDYHSKAWQSESELYKN